ncbi:UPF0132 membrane protein [Lentibacillus sp. JNUCC-1]|uniref:DUF4870 domain-containing protein n=1 Tax=Lentibacillus sp. JNUCC-1 TaxID=2654513 RepID=UPI0012E777B3|nr:DUF4870 domain-containing protein [Lentibacillus sp. JNUCC-1]MUV38177.1 UPF0132 membrane protein [Lentibacillus sp. JNUCC-1]
MSENQPDNKEQTVFKEEGASIEGAQAQESEKKTSTGLDRNVAALLCYLAGFVTGIVFLVIEKEDRFVRFHALQSIVTFVIIFVASLVLTAIPLIGWIIGLLLSPLSVVLWIVLMLKAYQGKEFKLPIAGNIAEKQLDQMGNK